jgi:SAM-dependent methyltransferase
MAIAWLRPMARTAPFEQHHARYDQWFVRHQAAYRSELLALRALLPTGGRGLEIGVGSGRFAAPLGVAVGVDPAAGMLRYAARRGIGVARAVAEQLPFRGGVFDYALVVTTICFVDNAAAMLAEAHRVLHPHAVLCVGFVDRDSPLGRFYLAQRAENVFYRDAVFYASAEVDALLREAGFRELTWMQTLFGPGDTRTDVEPVREGRDGGGFVAVRAVRS